MLERLLHAGGSRWSICRSPWISGIELAQPEEAGALATKSSYGRLSGKEERCLDAAFQDLLRACNVWHGARELEGSHHESEDGCCPTTRCCGIRIWEQCGQRRNEALQPILIGLPY